MYALNEGTQEGFSYLRFVYATPAELALIPRLPIGVDFSRRFIKALTLRNELQVLAHLAAVCEEQLTKYSQSREACVPCRR
ncbi:hypothetical protein EON66_07000 [archaeon]|nr:MAG: hypothetical protein EON66_07000 [archaeon]